MLSDTLREQIKRCVSVLNKSNGSMFQYLATLQETYGPYLNQKPTQGGGSCVCGQIFQKRGQKGQHSKKCKVAKSLREKKQSKSKVTYQHDALSQMDVQISSDAIFFDDEEFPTKTPFSGPIGDNWEGFIGDFEEINLDKQDSNQKQQSLQMDQQEIIYQQNQ